MPRINLKRARSRKVMRQLKRLKRELKGVSPKRAPAIPKLITRPFKEAKYKRENYSNESFNTVKTEKHPPIPIRIRL